MILNLLSNAIKFTPTGGEITIAMAKPEVNDSITFLKLSVKDNGIGMTEEERERIFIPYVQANAQIASQYGGSGLGLSISKRLIELMGGKIEVESKKGKGTKFSFTLKCPNVIDIKHNAVTPLIFSEAKPAQVCPATPMDNPSLLKTTAEGTSCPSGHIRINSLVG